MSFIYEDKELLKQLAKIAQVEPRADIDPSQLRLTALKAISNLRQMYSPVKVEGNAQIFQKDVFNLDSLLLWLIQNKVRVNGHRVAYASTPPAQPGSPAVQRGVVPGEAGEPIEEEDKQIRYVAAPGEPKVWREGLIEFLKNLRQQAAGTGNVYFQELVANVIEDANTHKFLDTGLEANEPTKEPIKEQQTPETTPTQNQEQSTQETTSNIGTQQVSYVQSVQDSLKEGGSEELILPFDLTTDMINLTIFNRFTNQLNALMSNPSFRQKMAEYFSMLETMLAAINNGIQNFRSTAAGTPVAEGGFTLSANDNADNFANTVGEYPKARNLLVILSPLVLSISNVVNILRADPALKDMIGDDILRQQVQRGRDYVNRINGFITYINIKAGRTQ
jgi:hypothetical protein